MLGLSTAWMSENLKNSDELFKILAELRLEFLELEYRMPESFFLKIKSKLKNKVISIHNFFPFPEEYSQFKPSGDLFLLSSPEREEREKAIQFTIKTIRTAHDLECSAVVLHLGKVEMDPGYKQFCLYFDSHRINSIEMDVFLSQLREERNAKKQRFVDAVLFSLEKLNQEAGKRDVSLGVENRYYFNEIPNFEEFEVIFQRFAGGNIFYWHDVGHGHVQEKLRIQSHQELLATYSPFLLGVHLHDALGYSDHNPPGKGEIDFNWIRQYIKNAPRKVLELHPRASLMEIKEGIALLRSLRYC